jgi:hypothetical protein
MVKGVAGQVIGAEMLDVGNGSPFAGVVTVYVTGDGGTQALGLGSIQVEGNGLYNYFPTAAETNYTLVAFTFTGPNAIAVTMQVATVPNIIIPPKQRIA